MLPRFEGPCLIVEASVRKISKSCLLDIESKREEAKIESHIFIFYFGMVFLSLFTHAEPSSGWQDCKDSVHFTILMLYLSVLVLILLLRKTDHSIFIFIVYGCLCSLYACNAHGGQKRASDSCITGVTDSCEPWYGC